MSYYVRNGKGVGFLHVQESPYLLRSKFFYHNIEMKIIFVIKKSNCEEGQ